MINSSFFFEQKLIDLIEKKSRFQMNITKLNLDLFNFPNDLIRLSRTIYLSLITTNNFI